MAETKISDIIIPEVFDPMVVERTAELSALVQSGIVQRDPVFDANAAAGGVFINLPFLQDISGADEVLSDSGSLTAAAITEATDVAALLQRGRAFGVNDLAQAISSNDPLGTIVDLVASYWSRRKQTALINTLTGIFATTMATTHTNDVASEDADVSGVNLDADVIIDSQQLLGDAQDKLTAISMHSVVFSNLKKLNLIDFIPDSEGNVNIPTYLGLRVIKDDGHPTAAGTTSGTKYTSYIYANNSVAEGDGKAPVPSELERDGLAGSTVLITRFHWVIHPRGVAFQNASVAGTTPTNAELATGSNWSKVWEDKNITIIKIVTNG